MSGSCGSILRGQFLFRIGKFFKQLMSRAGVIIIGQTVGEKPQHDRAKRVNIHAGIRLPGA